MRRQASSFISGRYRPSRHCVHPCTSLKGLQYCFSAAWCSFTFWEFFQDSALCSGLACSFAELPDDMQPNNNPLRLLQSFTIYFLTFSFIIFHRLSLFLLSVWLYPSVHEKTKFLPCEVPTLQPVRPGAHDPRQASWKLFWNVLDKEVSEWYGCKQEQTEQTRISWILFLQGCKMGAGASPLWGRRCISCA